MVAYQQTSVVPCPFTNGKLEKSDDGSRIDQFSSSKCFSYEYDFILKILESASATNVSLKWFNMVNTLTVTNEVQNVWRKNELLQTIQLVQKKREAGIYTEDTVIYYAELLCGKYSHWYE